MRRSFLSLPLVLVLSMFLVPYESLAQGCLGAGGGGLTGGVISSQNGQPCANIDALNLSAVYGAAIRVTVGNVQAGDNVTARINWNDGTGFTASFPLVNLGGGTWEVVSPRHFFPVLATACEYIPITEMSINGAVCSANWGTPPVFFRWNQEGVANAPSSVFDVTETATSVTIFEVCAGVSTNVTFTDRSNMNCNTNPGDVTIAANLNNRRRWRQFVYGGAGALNTITGGVTVTATPVPNGTAYTGPVISYLPLSSGAPLGTGGGPDVPLNQSVAGWLIPPTATVTETITVPATAVAGEEFVITTRYWNACNRYDLAGSAPVEYNATRIRVVGKPAAPNAVTAAAVCNGTTRSGMATFAISGAPGSATIRWYANTTGASPAVPGTVGALITTTTASGGGNSNIPFSTAFPGAAGTVMPAENYIVWATYLGASGSALCESQPRAVTRSVRELLDTPLSGTSLQAYTGGTGTVITTACPGTTVDFEVRKAGAAFGPPTMPVGGTTQYVWPSASLPAGWSLTGGQGTVKASYTVGTAAFTVSPNLQYTSAPTCINTANSPSQLFTPQIAPTAGGPTAVPGLTICQDASTVLSSVVAGTGVTQRWQVDIDGAGAGTFVDIPTAGGDPYSGETSTSLTINTTTAGAVTGARYRIQVTGTCGTVNSSFVTLTINPKAAITTQPISAPNICINGTKVFTVVASGPALNYQWQIDADGAGAGGFVNVPSVGGDPYTGETSASLTINTTGTGTTLDGAFYQVIVNSTTCPAAVTSNTVILTLQGPTTDITTGATAGNCVGSNLNLLATESFLNGSFASRAWTGTYDETGAPPLIVLTLAQLNALLTDGVGGSRRTALNPIFNSAGIGVNKTGIYVLTLTTTDDNGCSNSDVITVTVDRVTANILYGSTAGTITNNNLNAVACSGVNVFLNGNPSGGSGTYPLPHAWSVVSPAVPIGTLLNNSTIQSPIFNVSNTTGAAVAYVLRYSVADNAGCNFTTGAGTDITITVNPQPVVADQPIATLCSRTAVGVNFSASTSVAASTYNITAITPNGATIAAGAPVTGAGQAASVLANDAWSNTTNALINVTYTVIPVSAAGCSGAPFTVTIPVNPEPSIGAQNIAAICSRSTISTNFSSSPIGNVATATYNITAMSAPGLTPGPGVATVFPANGLLASALFDDSFTNTTNAQVNVVYTVVPVSAQPCSGLAFTVTVPINPEPVVANQTPTAVCSQANIGVPFNSSSVGSVATATYNITAMSAPGLTPGAGVATVFPANGLLASALNNDSFTNTTAAPVNVVYTVVPVSAGPASCAGNSFTVTVTINPEPVVAAQNVAAICSKQPTGVNFAASTSVAAATYNVTGVNLNGLTQFAGGTLTGSHVAADLADDAFTNTSGGSVNVIYTVVPISAGPASCSGASFTVTVPVGPAPDIAGPYTKTICSGEAVNYPIVLSPAGQPVASIFNWPLPTMSTGPAQGSVGTNVGQAGAMITDVLVNPGVAPITATYDITPSVGSCNGTMRSIVITINPVPAVETVTGSANVCVTSSVVPVVYSVTNFNPLDLTTSYSWSIPAGFSRLSGGGGVVPGSGFGPFTVGDGILVLNFPAVASGQIEVIKRNNFNCSTTAIPLTVTSVAAPPVLPIDVDPGPYCYNQTGVKFFISAPNPTSTYSWNVSGAGTISGSSVGPIISVNLGVGPFATASVTETNTIGCSTTFLPLTITINPVPDVLATPASQTICSGSATSIALSTPNGVPGTTYTWTVVQSGVTGAANQAAGVAGPIAQTLNTTGSATGTATYTITPSAGGCSGTPINVVITVNPIPTVASTPAASTLCSGQSTNIVLSNPNSVAGTQYFWTVVQSGVIGAGAGGTVATPVAGPIIQALTATTSTPGTATYTITPVANSCTGTPVVTVITVNPIPDVAATPPNQTICSGQTTGIALSNPNGVAGTQYFWTVVQAGVTGATASGTLASPVAGPISQALLTTASATGTATYTVTPVANGCAGTPINVVVTVNPIPNVLATPNSQTICSGQNTGIALSTPNGVPSTLYTWTVVQTNVAGASNQAAPVAGPIVQNLTATTSAAGTATYTITPIASSCSGTPIDVIITVNPLPNVVSVPAAETICSGQSTNLTLTNPNAVAGTQYFWTVVQTGVTGASNSGSLATPVNGPITQALTTTASAQGTAVYTITPVANGCAGTSTNVTVTVNPLPNVLGTPASQTICSGGTTGIALSTPNGVPATAYFWTVSQSGVTGGSNVGTLAAPVAGPIAQVLTTTVSATGTATYTITPVAAGCAGTPINVIITVNPVPVGVPTTTTVCSDVALGVNMNSLVVGGALSASTYNITNIVIGPGLVASAGAPTTGNNFLATEIQDDRWTNTTGVQRDVVYTIVPVSGAVPPCSGVAFDLTVHVDPEPVVVAVANQSFCPGDAVNIPLSSNVGGATMNWTNTNPTIGIPASGTGAIAFTAPANNTGGNIVGTITVSGTAAGCTSAGANTKSFTITIKPTPVMVANSNVVVCSGGVVGAIGFSANSGGGETFNWTNDTPGIGLAAAGVGNIASFSAAANISGVPLVATISVSATKNSCTGVATTFTITVNPEPVVTPVADQTFCPGDGVNIALASNVAGATMNWTNSNTSIGIGASGSGTISYVAPVNNTGVDIVGTITVTGSANGCPSAGANVDVFTITIKPSPIMVTNSNITVCSGTAVPLVTFSANTGGGEVFNWTNDNVAIGLAANGVGNIASYVAPINTTGTTIVGTISVTGTKNLCTGPAKTFTITILPQPVGVPTTITVCSDAAVGVNLSTLITGALGASTYNITNIANTGGLTASAGAPATGTSLSATVVQDDRWTNLSGVQRDIVYTIVPISGSTPACGGAAFDLTVHVDPEPVVVAVANQSFCPGDAVNIALSSNVAGATMNWTNTNPTIGLGASGTGNIVYTAPANNTGADLVGTITVSGTANTCTSAGANLKTFTITIKPTPVMVANSNVAVCSGAMVGAITFSANTAGGETFNWTNNTPAIGLAAAGVGNIASFAAAANITGSPIVATISVTATKNSCAGPASIFTITVNPEPVVTPVADQSFCPGDGVNIALASNVAGATMNWSNSNTSIGIGVSGSGNISYIAPANNTGVDIVGTITVTGTSNGCVSAGANVDVFTITIKPSPIMVTNANVTVCSGTAVPLVTFSANTGGGEVFNWTNDNVAIGLAAAGSGNIASYVAPVNTTGASIVGTISVTGTKNLCTGPAKTFTITILPQPVGVPTTITVCSDAAVGVNLSTLISGALGASTFNITAITNLGGLVASAGAPATGNNLLATEVQNDRWTNISGIQRDIVYTIVPNSGSTPSCSGAPFDLTVHVDPEPVVAAVVNQAFCPGDAVNIPLSSNVIGATLNWTNTNPAIGIAVSGTGNIVFTAPANVSGSDIVGTIAVSATLNGCASAGANAKTFTITIRPSPVMVANSNVVVCSGNNIAAINFAANSGGGEVFNWTNDTPGIGLAAAGIGNIAAFPASVNISGAPMVATISVTATKNGCVGAPSTFTITVNPEPVVANVTDVAVCSGTAVSAINFTANTAGGETFNWTNSNTAIGLAASGTGPIGSYIAPINATNVPIVGTITVTATKNGCTSAGANVETFTITINGQPAGAPDAATVNSDIAINYDLQNNINTLGNSIMSTFSWVAANNTSVSGESLAPQAGSIITDAIHNVTNANQIVLYTATPTSGGCVGNPFVITITVVPEPVGVNDAVTVNSDVSINYNLQNNVNGIGNGLPSTFTWVTVANPNVTGESTAVQTTGVISDIITNITGVDQFLTYTVTPTGTNGVPGDPFFITVTIRSEPVGANDVASTCSGIAISYDLQNNLNTFGNGQASTFTWFALANPNVTGESIVATPGAFINDNLHNFTGGNELVIYTVTPTGTNTCPGNTFQITVTVRPEPVVASTLNETKCSGVAYGKLLNTNGVSIGAATYDVTVVSKDAGITGGRPLGLIGGGGSADNVLMADAYTNATTIPQNVVYSVRPNGTNGCIGQPLLVTFTIDPEPVLSNPGFPAVCSSNTSVTNLVNVVLGTNGTSVAAASYQLTAIQYNDGSGFAAPPLAGFTGAGGNAPVLAVGDINLVRNDAFTNTLAVPVTVRYTIVATSVSGGCLSAPLNYDIVINPEPVLTINPPGLPSPVCSGVPTNIDFVGGATYNINSITFGGLTAGGSNTGIGTGKVATAIHNDVYVNTTSGPLPAIYKVAAVSAAGCIGPEVTITLTINPSPDLSNNLDRTVCSTGASGIGFTTTGASIAANNYNIINVTFPGLTPGANAAFPNTGVSAAYIAGDTYTNPTNGILTATYTVAPVSLAGCIGPAENIILTVEPTILAAPINHKPVNLCSSSPPTTIDPTDIELLSPTTASAGVITFNYTTNVVPAAAITGFTPALTNLASGYRIQDNLVNNTNAVATITYNITPVAAGARGGIGCVGAPVAVVVTVEPRPRLVPSTFLVTLCEGLGPNITLNSPTTPSSGAVVFDLVAVASTNTNGIVSGMSPLAPAPGGIFANGAVLNDILNSTSTTIETVTYTFRPRMTAAAGCTGSDVTVTVNVNPRPNISVAAAPVAPTALCSGEIFNVAFDSDVAGTVSTWGLPTISPTPGSITGVGSGAGDQIFQILFSAATSTQVQTVTYTINPQAAGCTGPPLLVSVNVNPVPTVLGTANATFCHGTTMNLPLSSNVPAGVTFDWTVSDPSGLGAPGSFDGSGTTINQLFSNTTGAQASLTYTIVPNLNAPGTSTGTCSGTSRIMVITVAPEITASFLNSPNPNFICNGTSEYLVFQFGGQAPFDFTYTRNIASPASSTPVTVLNKGPVAVVQETPTLNTGYTYTITSVTSHIGAATCTVPVNVSMVVNVDDSNPAHTILSPLSACSPHEVSIQYQQVAGTVYTWRFGDAGDSVYTATTTVPNRVIKHTYNNPVPTSILPFKLSLQTELSAPFPSCLRTTPFTTINVLPNVQTNVISDKDIICSGETVRFTNASQGSTSQTWSYRVQGQVPETAMGTTFNMNYVFTNNVAASNPIIYEVLYRASNGLCPTAPVIIPITVYQNPVASFNEGVVPDFINGESLVTFTNTSVTPNNANFNFDWVFGPDSQPPNFSGATPGTVRYVSPGPKDITLTVTNALRPVCASTMTRQIDILIPPLVAKFEADPKASCFPAKITVSNDPLLTEITGDIIEWVVVDQNNRPVATSSGFYPVFDIAAEGEYTIQVTTSSSQTGQTISYTHPETFVVYGKPFASFKARPDIVFVPDTEMTIFNQSPEATDLSFHWDFGDGDVLEGPAPPNDVAVPLGTHNGRTKGTFEDPIHIYKIEGIYELTMIASFDHGGGVVCKDTLKQQVQARQGGVTKVPNAFTPNLGGPSGGQSGTGGVNSSNDIFLPIVKGADEFNLQIYDRWGNLIFESNDAQHGWDGYGRDGQILPAGVYVYKLTVRLSDGQRSTQIGDVTMIR